MRLLGGGAAYEAYLAFDEVTYAPVVVKVLRPAQVEDRASLRGLRREVAALAAVNHPGVVRGLRHVVDGERPHVVLEHVDGPRLSSLVRRYGPLQPQQYLPLAIDVASALHYFRHVGQVHLDVKPSNIIMGSPARLIDLSVMRSVEAAARLDHVIGTDAYLSPEQADPGRLGVPGPRQRRLGAGRDAVPRHRRRAPVRRAATRRVARSRSATRRSSPTPPQLPGRTPEEVGEGGAACARAATRATVPRRTRSPTSLQPPPRTPAACPADRVRRQTLNR